MRDPYCIHGNNLAQRIQKKNCPDFIHHIYKKYLTWSQQSSLLNSEIDNELIKKIDLLNDYKYFVDSFSDKGLTKLQDKISSSILEEFLYYLFKDLISIKHHINNNKIYAGKANSYTDLSFAPKDINDFINRPGIYINKKNQDFTIAKIVNCVFETNGVTESAQLIVPAVAIECKTFIPSTMLGQSSYEASRMKQGNPYSLYLIVAEQNALSEDVNLKNLAIDEIFILRKQKRNSQKNKIENKLPIDFMVVKELYLFVKKHLEKPWFNIVKATAKGRLIQT